MRTSTTNCLGPGSKGDIWTENITHLTHVFTSWNRHTYGNIFRRKKRLLARLEGVDRSLMEGPNERLSHLKADLWAQYNSLLDQEEYWLHLSRTKWLKLGDRNTKFFHQSALIRRRHNRIEALLNPNDEWVYDDKDIRNLLI